MHLPEKYLLNVGKYTYHTWMIWDWIGLDESLKYTLPESNITSETMVVGRRLAFPFGVKRPIFRDYVSFRDCALNCYLILEDGKKF